MKKAKEPKSTAIEVVKKGRQYSNCTSDEIEWIIAQKTEGVLSTEKIAAAFFEKFDRTVHIRTIDYQWKIHQKDKAKKFNDTVIAKLASGVGEDFDLLNMNIGQLTSLKNDIYTKILTKRSGTGVSKEDKKNGLKDYLAIMDRIEKFTSLKFKVQNDNKDIVNEEINDEYFAKLEESFQKLQESKEEPKEEIDAIPATFLLPN